MTSSFSVGVSDVRADRELNDLPKARERSERVVCQPLSDQLGQVTRPALQLVLEQRIAEPQVDRPALHAQRIYAIARQPTAAQRPGGGGG